MAGYHGFHVFHATIIAHFDGIPVENFVEGR